ncbi:DNA mismatch repair protein MutS [Gordonia sp. TBRC 11910]|uniref:DNA mismatch repair protein MutS n=1 Tax=Gordonia asplenii TaxID=2725283 RepID=A0A848L210_9ACTN|nr:DNA mismatch repair protein MutS [Gordonia asplenii]NMO04497.1 DNA mismatch repair protein MutS [Gordonia asplenii]
MRAEAVDEFVSILAPQGSSLIPQTDDVLRDLALQRVFAQIDESAPRARNASRNLLTAAGVAYRQDVFRGLQNRELRAGVERYLAGLDEYAARAQTSSRALHPLEAQLWHLHSAASYVDAVIALRRGLESSTHTIGRGWCLLTDYLDGYLRSPAFTALASTTRAIGDELDRLRFNLLIDGPKVTVAAMDAESDLGEIVAATFDRFRSAEAVDHRSTFRTPRLDHVQVWILERVAQVHPEVFARLREFAESTASFDDARLTRLGDEVRFYLAYLDYVEPMCRAGLPMCFPTASAGATDVTVRGGWDLALGRRLTGAREALVLNDFDLIRPERIAVISGPNQGGKTTMARLFGQLHYLAAIGCPVPARAAWLPLVDRVLTVFEREERLDSLEGRLAAEIQRLATVFATATPNSAIVINEAFASTSLHDARILTADVLTRITELGAVAVCVTFIDEMSRLNQATVSYVSAVDPRDPVRRTFRIERRAADGRVYAHALAAEHRLNAEQIRQSIAAQAISTMKAIR